MGFEKSKPNNFVLKTESSGLALMNLFTKLNKLFF
jgi:hypothetical protein